MASRFATGTKNQWSWNILTLNHHEHTHTHTHTPLQNAEFTVSYIEFLFSVKKERGITKCSDWW